MYRPTDRQTKFKYTTLMWGLFRLAPRIIPIIQAYIQKNLLIYFRGALISKTTDIPIADISALKITDSNNDTDIVNHHNSRHSVTIQVRLILSTM